MRQQQLARRHTAHSLIRSRSESATQIERTAKTRESRSPPPTASHRSRPFVCYCLYSQNTHLVARPADVMSCYVPLELGLSQVTGGREGVQSCSKNAECCSIKRVVVWGRRAAMNNATGSAINGGSKHDDCEQHSSLNPNHD